MRIRIGALLAALTLLAALGSEGRARGADPANALPARALTDSSSLYLRQAAAGAVRWQPWSEATLKLARRLDRPLLIDLGAAWCHWCHVMDKTTYADPEVAALMNRYYVPIKVDVDARPDLDGYYQEAASRLSGAGGWPLTCLAMPNGALFLALGYVPPRPAGPDAPEYQRRQGGAGMVAVLKRVAAVWAKQRAELEKSTREIAAALAKPPQAQAPSKQTPGGLLGEIVGALAVNYDREQGAFGAATGPRFFDFPAIELALAHGFWGHREFTSMALESLRKIARGGVYDQLGGGFHRYSTDPYWQVPHFEKMAYDQAMAITAYAEAYQVSGDQEFERVARGAVGYVNSTLLDPATSTFYSHQDADSFAGDDGSYYTWTREEVARALKPEVARAAALYFGIDDHPGLAPDGRIVLRRAQSVEQVAKRLETPVAGAQALINQAAAGLFQVREQRRHPQVDRAVLVDRNALLAAAYLRAAQAFKDPTLERTALAAIDYARKHARAPDGTFYHVWVKGKGQATGLVADQVYMLSAMLAAYQASGSRVYLDDSRALAGKILVGFRDPASGLLHDHKPPEPGAVIGSTGGSASIFYDRPIPSPQGMMAQALQTLAALTSEGRYATEAAGLLAAAPARVNPQAGTLLATLGLALEAEANGDAVVAIVGAGSDRRTRALLGAALGAYRPGKVVLVLDPAAARGGGLPATAQSMFEANKSRAEPLAFVCAGKACANPVSAPAKLVKLVREFGLAQPG